MAVNQKDPMQGVFNMNKDG